MGLVHDVRWKQVLTAYTKGQFIYHQYDVNILFLSLFTIHTSGAATTASRLGQPDLAIATLNDFVEVIEFLDPLWANSDRLCILGGANGQQLEFDDTRHRGCGHWVRHHFHSKRFVITSKP